MGFECPDTSDDIESNLDNVVLGRLENRFLSDRDRTIETMRYVKRFDNAVFKSISLMRSMNEIQKTGGFLVGMYRHPSAWKKAHRLKVIERQGRKAFRGAVWWYDFHTYLLMFHKKFGFPLIDFSMDFEHDMRRHFGDCISHYDPSRINHTDYEDSDEVTMELYGELTECRKSMAPITLTPNMLPMRNVGTN